MFDEKFAPDEVLMYLRKSRTDDPRMTVEEVLEMHEKQLNEWCIKSLGGLIPECNRFREIVSGETIKARPEFQKVLRLIEQPQYKAVAVVDCSRLGRPDLEDIGRITKIFRFTSTFLLTPDFSFDLTDEFGRERLKMELERSNWYLEAFKKLNIRGRQYAVANGFFIGSVAPYGFNRVQVKDGKRNRYMLEINPQEADIVKMVYDLYVGGMGVVNISHRLNELRVPTRSGGVWTSPTIKGMLKNEHYIGKIIWNRRKTITTVADGEIAKIRPRSTDYDLFEGKHERIVDDETFYKAQEMWGRNARLKKSNELVNPLAGLVYCKCGRSMTLRKYHDKDGLERSAPRLLCINQTYCNTASATYDEILEQVIHCLEQNIADFDLNINADNRKKAEQQTHLVERLNKRLDELKKKELKQWEKYSLDGMPKAIFEQLNASVLEEQEAVQKAIDEATASTPTVAEFEEKKSRFSKALEALLDPNASATLKNNLLKTCIGKIEYTRKQPQRMTKAEAKRQGLTLSVGGRWTYEPMELTFTLKV